LAPWLSAPLGVGIHALAILALAAATLFTPIEDMSPNVAPLLLHLAPPPSQALGRGGALEAESPPTVEPSVARTTGDRPRFTPSISDEILTASFAVPIGVELGFGDGDRNGMGGISAGVLGGVPGGLPGGVIGGLGSELPRFPQPDVGPTPIRMPQPSYTQEAIRDNVTGAVVLRVVIDEQGRVRVLKVVRSVPALDEEAIRVVESRWRFQPATKNGRPVPALSDLVVRFNLY
jgi:protein TonB